MNERLKDAGEKFILRWLWTERGTNEDETKIYNMDLLPSPGLIEELIAYHREGNFDRVMGFMQLMFSVEEEFGREIKKEPYKSDPAKYLVDNMNILYKKRK
jgi:hypothetical protein